MSVEQYACGQPSPPPIPPLERRVKCNRVAGHDGPHRRIRARDFTVVVEWTERGGYTIAAGKPVTP